MRGKINYSNVFIVETLILFFHSNLYTKMKKISFPIILLLMTWVFSSLQAQNTELMTETGIITKTSNQDFETTYQKLRTIIEENPNLTIILELDHQANAAKKGLELTPTKLIVFGNPMMGTPLMQANPLTGLDLPQKILVYENAEGLVKVSYNDPTYLSNRHELTTQSEILAKVSGALDTITNKAIE